MNIEILKRAKKNLGFTNAQVAEKSGVSLGTVNKLFAGQVQNPGVDTIKAIEKALGYPPANYLDVENDICLLHDSAAEKAYMCRYTVDDLYALPGDRRVELIDGDFYDLASPRISHQQIISRLFFKIMKYISDNNGKCQVFPAPVGVRLDKDQYTELQPDIIVVCDEDKIKEQFIWGAPDWALEVISPSTKSRDYLLKAHKYMEAGVKEYWIVDLKDEKITVFIKDEEDGFEMQTYKTTDRIKFKIFPGLEIDMAKETEGIKY